MSVIRDLMLGAVALLAATAANAVTTLDIQQDVPANTGVLSADRVGALEIALTTIDGGESMLSDDFVDFWFEPFAAPDTPRPWGVSEEALAGAFTPAPLTQFQAALLAAGGLR